LGKEKLYRIALIALTILQIGLAAVYLNTLSRIDNWSVVYAEDSKGYLLVADYYLGRDLSAEDIPLMKYRLFSPVIPFAASILGKFIGVPAAFLCINFILWNLTALIFYELLNLLLKNNYNAFVGAAIFTTSLPMIEWGLPVMVDMGAYFFACLIPYLYLKLFHPRPDAFPSAQSGERETLIPAPWGRGLMDGESIYKNILLSLCLGLAILTKPTLVTVLLFVLFSLLYAKRYRSALILFVLPTSLVASVYWLCGLSVGDFTAFSAPRHRGVIYLLTAAFFCFHWGWVFFWRGWQTTGENKQFYLLYLITFICPFVFFVHNPRLFFLASPAVIPLIASGMNKKNTRSRSLSTTGSALIIGYIITSNALAVFHLYVMRYLKIRDWEGLIDFFSSLVS
jgi:4-amino-4-deoxy-L-arabinose transferase-like glycosyltransferase